MKTVVLNDIHERLGARMGEFAGWRLPIDYGSAVREVAAVRNAAGIFDVSHMGRLDIFGHEALSFLQLLLTNDASALAEGAGRYTLMCNPEGGILDDLIVIRRSAELYLAVVNASNLEKDKAWISEHLSDAKVGIQRTPTIVDCTSDTSMFAVQGPESGEIMASAGVPTALDLRRFHGTEGAIEGCEVFVSRTGYTGEDGFEVICATYCAETVWTALLATGEPKGLIPCGLAARDVLRTEAALPLYGHEMDERTSPVEAGLMRWVRLEKSDFIGRDAIAAIQERGPTKKLVGIEMLERAVPRPGDLVHSPVGDGVVTSGTFSPTLARGIAMAYLPPKAAEGMQVEVLAHEKPRSGIVTRLPFYSRKT